MNKIVVLETNNGRLANQLWNAVSVFSYCLEKGYDYENYPFLKYQNYFNHISPKKAKAAINSPKIGAIKQLYLKCVYWVYKFYYKIIFRRSIINDLGVEFILSPSIPNSAENIAKLSLIDRSEETTWYFCGWLFRNPDGIKKYHDVIKQIFKPRIEYTRRVDEVIQELKTKNYLVVGVHIRQGDYKKWRNGVFYFDCKEVRIILNDFIKNVCDGKKVIFVLCSDEEINEKDFVGLNYIKGFGTEIEDLYCLASTDIILGSNSTYGSWAAYYGNIPFCIFSHEKIDWSKYNYDRL